MHFPPRGDNVPEERARARLGKLQVKRDDRTSPRARLAPLNIRVATVVETLPPSSLERLVDRLTRARARARLFPGILNLESLTVNEMPRPPFTCGPKIAARSCAPRVGGLTSYLRIETAIKTSERAAISIRVADIKKFNRAREIKINRGALAD